MGQIEEQFTKELLSDLLTKMTNNKDAGKAAEIMKKFNVNFE